MSAPSQVKRISIIVLLITVAVFGRQNPDVLRNHKARSGGQNINSQNTNREQPERSRMQNSINLEPAPQVSCPKCEALVENISIEAIEIAFDRPLSKDEKEIITSALSSPIQVNGQKTEEDIEKIKLCKVTAKLLEQQIFSLGLDLSRNKVNTSGKLVDPRTTKLAELKAMKSQLMTKYYLLKN